MKSLKGRWLYHAYAWTGYMVLLYLVNRLNEDPPSMAAIAAVTMLFILVFYLVLFVLRRFFDRKRYVRGTLALLGSYLALPLVTYAYIYLMLPPAGVTIAQEHVPFSHTAFLKNVVIGTTRFSVYALVYYLVGKKLATERERNAALREKLLAGREKLRVEREKLRHEQAALGMQLNPHALYNVINGLYARALEADGVLAERLLLLSSLMEYAARVPQLKTGVLPMEKEWAMVETFRQLLTADPSDTDAIRLEVKGKMSGQPVLPFACITLLENGWKHGRAPDARHPLKLRLTATGNWLRVQCSNAVGKRRARAPSLRSGLANLSRRLQIAFGEGAYVTTCERDGRFYTHLGIQYE